MRTDETPCAENKFKRGSSGEILMIHGPHRGNDALGSPSHRSPLKRNLTRANTEAARLPRRLRDSRARNERLGRNAGHVDATPPDHVGTALNKRGFDAFVSQFGRECLAALAAAEDDYIIWNCRAHDCFLLCVHGFVLIKNLTHSESALP